LLGVPTIVLFAVSNPDIRRPIGPNVKALEGCHQRKKPEFLFNLDDIVWSITPEEVVQAVREMTAINA
jgi:hypothetical protein